MDGTNTSTATTGGNPFATVSAILGANSGNFVGAACEVGFADVALTTGNQTALNSNVHTRYGF